MHELLLFAPVPAAQHHGLKQQLSGLTAMQPSRVLERRLVFKPYRKPGFIRPRPGGSQDVQSSEVQKLYKMLSAGLYHVQVTGRVREMDFAATDNTTAGGGDTVMQGTDATTAAASAGSYVTSNQTWRVEFKDTPEAGTGSGVTSRQISTATVPYGDVLPIMTAWGFDYVSEYLVEGDMFILEDAVLFLHRVLNFPSGSDNSNRPIGSLPSLEQMIPLDPSGGYILQAFVIVQDANPDMLKTAAQRLLRLRDLLRSAVRLEPADRLSLDTRVK